MQSNSQNATERMPSKSHNFTDSKGDVWTVSLDVWTIKHVLSETGINLLKLAEGDVVAKLIGDPITLVAVLWCVCEDRATERGISEKDYGKRMAGDAIDQATGAMLDALVDFTPNARDRANLSAVMSKTREIMEIERDRIQDVIEGGKLDQMMAQMLGPRSTSSPA